MASVDSVLPWTGKAKRVSEAEKNKRNHFQCCKATISVHLNKSHFMRISSKLQQLNVDTRDEIYHRKLLFRFFNRTRYLILKRRASLLAVIDKNKRRRCRVVELGTEQTIGLFILRSNYWKSKPMILPETDLWCEQLLKPIQIHERLFSKPIADKRFWETP